MEQRFQHQSGDQSARWRLAGYENHEGQRVAVVVRTKGGVEHARFVSEYELGRIIDNRRSSGPVTG